MPTVLGGIVFSCLSDSSGRSSLVGGLLLIGFLSSLLPISVIVLFSKFVDSFCNIDFIKLPGILGVSTTTTLFVYLSRICYCRFVSQKGP